MRIVFVVPPVIRQLHDYVEVDEGQRDSYRNRLKKFPGWHSSVKATRQRGSLCGVEKGQEAKIVLQN
jgi:hypothetical protein